MGVNTADPLIKVERVSLAYKGRNGEQVKALDNVSFDVNKGEVVSIIGPSGCGKTSLLSLMSGIIRPDSGRLLYKGEEVVSPSRERVIIFQNYVLFPWKTSIQNIEFVLMARKFDKSRLRSEAERYLKLVGLSDFSGMYPCELSGGMQQRVGIARALAADPEVLLLDEPFASLDPITRNIIQEELLSMVRKLNKTLILVTHNIEEALFLGSRVHVMSGQPGTIRETIDVRFDKPDHILELNKSKSYVDLANRIHELLISESVGEGSV